MGRRRKQNRFSASDWDVGTYTSTKTGEKHRYRSSWELRYMAELDLRSDVVSWEYESVAIPYINERGKRKRYIPDFIVHTASGSVLVEVKPNALKTHPTNLLKEEAARSWCATMGYEYESVSYG